MKKVAIILINFTGYAERFLIDCRDSLRMQNFPKENYQVYIVDNASTELSRQYLRENFSEAKIIPRGDGNYAAANNAGIKTSLADGCDLFVCLNLDAVVEQNWLIELVRAVNSEKSIGLAQSLIMLYPPENNQVNSAGNIINYLGFGFTGSEYNDCGQQSLPADTENEFGASCPEIKGYASGCSLMIKKETLEKIGFYNEEYYMYHDDLEFCWRAKLAGYKIALAPRSIAYHKYEFSRSVKMLYYLERNRYLAIFSFYKLPTILLLLPAMIAADLAMILFSMAGGWFKIKMKVEAYFLKLTTWKHIIRTRRQIKEYRLLKDREIMRDFCGQIIFQEIDNFVLKHIGNPLMLIYWLVAKKIIIW